MRFMPRSADGPRADQCLEGARLGLANARSLYVSSLALRRRGHIREAVFLLATAVEELAKAGTLHRAWMFREHQELYERAIAGWREMMGGRGAHQRKYAAAVHQGTNNMLAGFGMAYIIDILSRDRSTSAVADAAEMFLGGQPKVVPPWFDQLWRERQAIFVGWRSGQWEAGDGGGAAFYDGGRVPLLMLFRNLRSDVQRSR